MRNFQEDLSYVVTVKSTVEISQNFVAFSEYMNFNEIEHWVAKITNEYPDVKCFFHYKAHCVVIVFQA